MDSVHTVASGLKEYAGDAREDLTMTAEQFWRGATIAQRREALRLAHIEEPWVTVLPLDAWEYLTPATRAQLQQYFEDYSERDLE